jgi:pyridoxal phosphate enzyme (YggS family)
MPDAAGIAANIAWVLGQIEEIACRCGRDPRAIRLIAVTKTFPPELVRIAYQCGLRDFGENRVQEFTEKQRQLVLPDANFHLIGHLQSNKVSDALDFGWIHTIDSERLARRMNDAASRVDKKVSVLVQVAMDDRPREGAERSGVAEAGAEALAKFVTQLENIILKGLMVLPPYTANPEDARSYFRRLRELRDRLRRSGLPGVQELSMGMTHDFPVAIEEGATMLRIGTAIFGRRDLPTARKEGK